MDLTNAEFRVVWEALAQHVENHEDEADVPEETQALLEKFDLEATRRFA
jgi:hypothetical protein